MGALDRVSVAAIGTSVAELEAETLRAEAGGVECVWAPELFRSAFTQAAYLAAKTERIGVGTGIAWAFTRSPFIAAISALDVDEMSGDRFRLGMGAGVKRTRRREKRCRSTPPRCRRGWRGWRATSPTA